MRRGVQSSVGVGAVFAVIAVSLLLPGCPLSDGYYIEPPDAHGGAGMDAGGAGSSSAAGASVGGSVAGESNIGSGGDDGSGTSGCVSLTNLNHEYVFCFSPLTQAEARTICVDRGMTLAVIEAKAENDWIMSTLAARYSGPSPRAFIGANDMITEGEWRWADGALFWKGGAPVIGHYANWAPGQPDPGPMGASADCLSINIADGKWDDVSCTAELPYVCEPR